MPHVPEGALRAGEAVCRQRRAEVKRWLAKGRTGPQIVRQAMLKWGHTRRSAQKYLRAAREELGLLVRPGEEQEPAEGFRSDGRSYCPRVDGVTAAQRVEQMQAWIAQGRPPAEILRAGMAAWGVLKPQAMRYLRRAWDGLAEPRGARREKLRAEARELFDRLFLHAYAKMQAPNVQRRVREREKDGKILQTVETITRSDMSADAAQMARHALLLLTRIDGLDPCEGHRNGRPPGMADPHSKVWSAPAPGAAEKAVAPAAPAAPAAPVRRKRSRAKGKARERAA